MIRIESILDVEKHIQEAEAVIFDLDDTLYSEKEYVQSGYRKIAQAFGLPEVAGEMWQVFERGGKAIDEVLEIHDLIDRKAQALQIYRHQSPDIHLYHGVREMLDRIRKNKAVGIITDGRPEGQRAKLEALQLSVDAVIITDELGGPEFRKPCPVAFEKMQQAFGVPFNKMVYIGDNPRKDFVAPIQLNMQCIYVQNKDGIYYEP